MNYFQDFDKFNFNRAIVENLVSSCFKFNIINQF